MTLGLSPNSGQDLIEHVQFWNVRHVNVKYSTVQYVKIQHSTVQEINFPCSPTRNSFMYIVQGFFLQNQKI